VALGKESLTMPPTIISSLEERNPLVISAQDLEKILEKAVLLDEVDTCLNKTIRLLEYDDELLLQEYSFDGDIILRKMESREAADALVQARLETYERMWDGCGCKINFFE
jgi:hypothetical protein